MTVVAIPTRYPTLIKNAAEDDLLSWMGDFVWPPGKGPVENILRLVDLGLIFVLPFPFQVITLTASIFGYDLMSLGRHIDKVLDLKDIKDLAGRNLQEEATKFLGGMPVAQQAGLIKEFASSQTQKAHDGLPLSAKQIHDQIEKDAVLGVAGKALMNLLRSWSRKGVAAGTSNSAKGLIKTLGNKSTLAAVVMGGVTLLGWLIKMAFKLVSTPIKYMVKNPGKTLLGAGAVGISAYSYDENYDPTKDNLEQGKLTGEIGSLLDKEGDKLVQGKPRTFRGKIEQAVDQTILGAY